jgi:hypothetical protein
MPEAHYKKYCRWARPLPPMLIWTLRLSGKLIVSRWSSLS